MSRAGPPATGGIWIQGAGELASGIAVRLFRCGYRLVLAEEARPRAVRRLVAFAEAVYAGRQSVAGVAGLLEDAPDARFRSDRVTVVVDPAGGQIPRLRPAAIIDARMTKRPPAVLPTGDSPVIGIGPGLRCGRDCALVVETQRGPRLGAVIVAGEAAPDSGVPGPLGGETVRRLLRSPAAGRLLARRRIGDLVARDEIVAEVGGIPLPSPLAGRLRGLIHESVELLAGDKVGDVDPRGGAVDPALVSDKALAVAGGAVEALLRLGVLPVARS